MTQFRNKGQMSSDKNQKESRAGGMEQGWTQPEVKELLLMMSWY